MGVSVYVCVRESVCECICMCVWRKLCEGKKGGRRLTKNAQYANRVSHV